MRVTIDPVERATKAQTSAADREAEFGAAHAALLDQSEPEDFDAALALRERRAQTKARLDLARERRMAADAALAKAQEQAREQTLRAEEEDFERESAALGRRLAREYPKLAEPIVALVAEAVENGERGRRLNERRRAAGRPYIPTAEERVRMLPARTIPATFRDETVWLDGNGRQPSQYRKLPDGRVVDMAGSPLRQVTRSVQQSPERFEPARSPPRLAESVVLPGLRADDPPFWSVRS